MSESQSIQPWMYRSPNEGLVLFITLCVLVAVGWLFLNLNLYIFVGGVVFAIVGIHIQQTQYLGSAVRVYSKQFPEIYELFKAHATKLEIAHASLYIRQDPTLNAGTTGINRCTVVLNSGLFPKLVDYFILKCHTDMI